MTAATDDREAAQVLTKEASYTVEDGVTIYGGTMVNLDASQEASPAADSASETCVGVCYEQVDNTDDGEVVKVRRGIHALVNSSGNAVDASDEGNVVYVEDDQTVATTSSNLVKAGICRGMYGSLVLVEFEHEEVLHASANLEDLATVATARTNLGVPSSAEAALVANNLSDLAVAATARTNLGFTIDPTTEYIYFYIDDLIAANAYRALLKLHGTGSITKIETVLRGAALATGNTTLTGKLDGTGITDGVVTITQSGSAVGDEDSVTPSALNVFTDGQLFELLVGGTNDDATADAGVCLTILRD